MGNTKSKELADFTKEFINEQFSKAKKDPARHYLTLSEVLKLETPDDCKVELNHLGNLFVLDGNNDGRVSLKDLRTFAVDVMVQ